MTKPKGSKAGEKNLVARVKKEMDMPRLTNSVRNETDAQAQRADESGASKSGPRSSNGM